MFSEEVARLYTAEIVSAISYLHSRSIVHRDLKVSEVHSFLGHIAWGGLASGLGQGLASGLESYDSIDNRLTYKQGYRIWPFVDRICGYDMGYEIQGDTESDTIRSPIRYGVECKKKKTVTPKKWNPSRLQ